MDMVYVATKPEQPGAAYAICVDRPEFKTQTAKNVAGWIKEGATVLHVEHHFGCDMLDKWIRNKSATTPDFHALNCPDNSTLR